MYFIAGAAVMEVGIVQYMRGNSKKREWERRIVGRENRRE
jgi:hypothetical protein